MKRSPRRARRSPAAQVVEHLRAADRFPSGDPRRESAQRKAARAAAADIDVLDDALLAEVRTQLRRWARFAPYLLDDDEEAAIARANHDTISEQLETLRSLEADATTSLASADAALRRLDDADPDERRQADVRAHQVTAQRSETVASVLGALARCHLDDDARRSIDDWRTRFALVQGTTPTTLAHLRAATRNASVLAAKWWNVRSAIVGAQYADRRVGVAVAPASLDEHAAAAAAGVAAAVPALARSAHRAAASIRPGMDNEVVIEADGRISATVDHRPTARGALMVAHELGHAVHALEARSSEPPGALVGETVACWSSLVAGRDQPKTGVDAVASALALGDTLVEELFVSAAVSSFEDGVYQLVRTGSVVSSSALDALWLSAHRQAMAGAVDVPDVVGSGWARLPSLATDPGHAISYVWATVLALAIGQRDDGDEQRMIAAALASGGVDADEFTVLLGFNGDEWIEVGFQALERELDRLAQLVRAGDSP